METLMILSIYQDKNTMWHDRPCKNGEPRSNNAWIYSAYSTYLAPKTVDSLKRYEVFKQCGRSLYPIKIDRLPGKIHPSLSKDEILGLTHAGFITRYELEASHWNFCNLDYKPEKLTLKTIWISLKALYNVRKEVKKQGLTGSRARNYIWENNIIEAYPLAFYLAPWDQYYVVRYNEQRANLLQTLAFYINFIFTLIKGNKSVRMLLWLQLEDLDHFLLKLIPRDKWVRDYFDKDHPFVKGLE